MQFKKILNISAFFVALAALSVFSSLVPANAQVEIEKKVETTKFSCGSGLVTYKVSSLDSNHKGSGIRCVLFTNSYNSKAPTISWYGEGSWNGCTYRHVGQAFFKYPDTKYNYLKGYSSDIYGNGECAKNTWDGNLQIKSTFDQSNIYVTGPWNELWIRVGSIDYKPLTRPTKCGKYFDQYKVTNLVLPGQPFRTGEGLRCVLQVGGKNTTWFGNGNWNKVSYSHLGTKGVYYKKGLKSIGYGAKDISGKNFGTANSTYAFGSLIPQPLLVGLTVTGSWHEYWI